MVLGLLVDADLANNSAGWQWIAGCGADAAPYFRIFNPITQGVKFDAEGDYIRRYVPDLPIFPMPTYASLGRPQAIYWQRLEYDLGKLIRSLLLM